MAISSANMSLEIMNPPSKKKPTKKRPKAKKKK
jgi:hypothetical protein